MIVVGHPYPYEGPTSAIYQLIPADLGIRYIEVQGDSPTGPEAGGPDGIVRYLHVPCSTQSHPDLHVVQNQVVVDTDMACCARPVRFVGCQAPAIDLSTNRYPVARGTNNRIVMDINMV